jgi:pimeloyl-ACP methyl ester carboxylesterase
MTAARCLTAVFLGVATACSDAPAPAVDAVAAAEARLGIDLEERSIETNGVRLHVVLAGPPDGPPVVLLHGIPEFWYGWHRQIGPLARTGFRVIVPDQRGYNASDKPEGVEAYRGVEAVNDVVGLIDALGYERVRLAGHDAGAGVAWQLAIEHPERIERLAVFGIGHPEAFREMREAGSVPLGSRLFYGTLAVMLRSRLPEWLAPRADWAPLVQILRRSSAGVAFPDDELPYYRQAWERDGSFHFIMNWYRAMFAEGPRAYTRDVRVEPPALVVALGKDPIVPQEPARRSGRFCANARIVELADASHWVLHEQPEATAALLVDFFTPPGSPAR